MNGNLISCTVNVVIEYSPEASINETISINSNREMELRELTKLSVHTFNTLFENKQLHLRLKKDSLDYQLLPVSNQREIRIKPHTKVIEFESFEFSLKYNPQDIMINFPKSQKKCCCCILI